MHSNIQKDNIFVLGDTHDLDIMPILEHHAFQNFLLIHVGDFSIGFRHPKREHAILEKIQEYLENNNGYLIICRGNHDNPEFFNKHHKFNNLFPNIEFAEDYTYKTINDKTFLFVGGAISIDRQARTTYSDYWPMEKFVLPEKLETLDKCDVLITHTSAIDEFPNTGFANIAGWFKNDPTLKEELIEEREKMSKLYNQANPKIGHWFGHFHTSDRRFIDDVKQQCLDINEVVQINI